MLVDHTLHKILRRTGHSCPIWLGSKSQVALPDFFQHIDVALAIERRCTTYDDEYDDTCGPYIDFLRVRHQLLFEDLRCYIVRRTNLGSHWGEVRAELLSESEVGKLHRALAQRLIIGQDNVQGLEITV